MFDGVEKLKLLPAVVVVPNPPNAPAARAQAHTHTHMRGIQDRHGHRTEMDMLNMRDGQSGFDHMTRASLTHTHE